jgi:hypothetical protein
MQNMKSPLKLLILFEIFTKHFCIELLKCIDLLADFDRRICR